MNEEDKNKEEKKEEKKEIRKPSEKQNENKNEFNNAKIERKEDKNKKEKIVDIVVSEENEKNEEKTENNKFERSDDMDELKDFFEKNLGGILGACVGIILISTNIINLLLEIIVFVFAIMAGVYVQKNWDRIKDFFKNKK